MIWGIIYLYLFYALVFVIHDLPVNEDSPWRKRLLSRSVWSLETEFTFWTHLYLRTVTTGKDIPFLINRVVIVVRDFSWSIQMCLEIFRKCLMHILSFMDFYSSITFYIKMYHEKRYQWARGRSIWMEGYFYLRTPRRKKRFKTEQQRLNNNWTQS